MPTSFPSPLLAFLHHAVLMACSEELCPQDRLCVHTLKAVPFSLPLRSSLSTFSLYLQFIILWFTLV